MFKTRLSQRYVFLSQKYKEFERSVHVEEIDGLKLVKKLAENLEEMFHKKAEAMKVGRLLCVHVCLCLCAHVSLFVCTCVFVCVYMYLCLCACLWKWVFARVCLQGCITSVAYG